MCSVACYTVTCLRRDATNDCPARRISTSNQLGFVFISCNVCQTSVYAFIHPSTLPLASRTAQFRYFHPGVCAVKNCARGKMSALSRENIMD